MDNKTGVLEFLKVTVHFFEILVYDIKEVKRMDRFWSWSGRYIGVRQNGYLVSCSGSIIGKFWGNELYNCDGEYIGEIMRQNRLIKNPIKTAQHRTLFSSYIRGTITQCYRDYAPYPMVTGYEDFVYEE